MLAKAQNLASLRLLAWGSVSSYHKSFASGISEGGLSTPHKTAAESGAYEIEKSGDSGASLATNFRQLHLPHSPAAALSVVDITASRCRPLSTLSRPFIHTAVSSQKVCEARLAHRRGYSGTHDEDRDAGSLPPDGNPNVEDTNGTTGSVRPSLHCGDKWVPINISDSVRSISIVNALFVSPLSVTQEAYITTYISLDAHIYSKPVQMDTSMVLVSRR